MQRIGFLGLGIMGRAMAHNLVKAGYELTVWNRSPQRCDDLVRDGATRADSPQQVVSECDITLAMVSDPEAAKDLCFSPKGVLSGLTPGKGYIDFSTVDPETAIRIGSAVADRGGRFLEAPVSGSKKPAEEGALVILAAGDRALYDELSPLFGVLAKRSFHLGSVGQGAKMKLVVNMIMGIMMTGLGEGLALARAAELPETTLLEVLELGAMANPMFRLKGPTMLAGDFPPAFPLKHMQKDLRLALALGDALSQPLAAAASSNSLYVRARALGLGDEDFSSVIRAVVPESSVAGALTAGAHPQK